jgi:hypothetical protein
MNLIQIQEHLKDLPTQVIMSYANGQNPEVPPYMALGELNRRKTSEQRKAEPPTQSVKEKLESEVGAPQGVAQGMPPGIPQAAPQGIAQLPGAQMAPQGMPQGMPQQAPGMAGGGLTELPVRNDMFNYAPGGIVAFGGGGEADEETAGEAEARAAMEGQGPPIAATAPSGLESLKAPAIAAIAKAVKGETDEPVPTDPEVIRQEILKKNPELAKLVNTIPGSQLAILSEKLAAQNEAGKAQFKESQKRMGLGALGDALIAAGEATRGQKGIGAAFAGFGKSYSNYTAEDIKRQQAQQALERQQMIEVGKLDADIETLKQAYAKAQIEGRTADAITYKKELNDRIIRKQNMQLGGAEKALSTINTEMQTKGTLAHYAATEKNAALTLQEMIRNHADQASIERQRNAVTAANVASEVALRKVQADVLLATRPTAAEKIDQQTQAKVNADPRIKGLSDRLKTAEIGSDDYYTTLDEIQKFALTHYPPGTKLPEIPRIKKPEVKEEPGFFSRMFGGSPAPKTVSFDQLPK